MGLHSHKTDPRSLISDNTSMFRWFVVARSHFRKIRSVIVNVWGADFLPRFCGCLQLTLEWQSGTVSFLFFRQTQRYNTPDKRLIQLIFRRLSSEVVLWRGKLHRQEKKEAWQLNMNTETESALVRTYQPAGFVDSGDTNADSG